MILQFSVCQRDSIFEHISTFVSMLEVVVTLLVDSSVCCCHGCCLSDKLTTCLSACLFVCALRIYLWSTSLLLVAAYHVLALTAAVAGVTMTFTEQCHRGYNVCMLYPHVLLPPTTRSLIFKLFLLHTVDQHMHLQHRVIMH